MCQEISRLEEKIFFVYDGSRKTQSGKAQGLQITERHGEDMNIIVTVDENWAIGKGGDFLTRIPAEQRNTDSLTLGKTIIMGRKTLQALPQGQPLYGRENIILTQDAQFAQKGVTVAHSVEELEELLAEKEQESIFVYGGESVFKALLPKCDTAYVLYIEKSYDANRFFENLDRSEGWELTEESDEQTYFDITYYFRKYERKA